MSQLNHLYINKLVFKNGTTLELGSNDIILFVGPNNVGKSATLSDIKQIISDGDINERSRLVSSCSLSFEFTKQSLLDEVQYVSYEAHETMIDNDDIEMLYSNKVCLYKLYDFFVKSITALENIEKCDSLPINASGASKYHPAYMVANDQQYRDFVADHFHRAFGEYILPNENMGVISLHIGKKITVDDDDKEDIYTLIAKRRSVLNSYPIAQNQGDGMKAYLGLLLNLYSTLNSIYFIDEPEAFLHPPQAVMAGRMLGEVLHGKKQVFIATHSRDIIKGLLDVCPERLRIVRLMRHDEAGQISN